MRKLFCIILLFLLLTTNVGQAQFNDSEPMFGQMLNFSHWATDGLVFYWRGIPSGKAADESGYGNDGVITGATWVGGALSFDGGYVLVPNSESINIAGDLTLIVRARKPTGTGEYTLLGKQGKNQYWMTVANNTIRFFIGGNQEISSVTAFVDDLWSTVAITVQKTPQFLQYYINGVQVDSDDYSAVMVASSDDLYIGIDPRDAIGLEWPGQMSDVKIYNRSLSASEIAALYLNPALPMQQELIWLFTPPGAPSGIVVLRRRRECA